VFTLCRILFLLFNSEQFPVVYFTDFLVGFWFDLMTAAIVFLPLWLLELFPSKWRDIRFFRIFFAACFHIVFFLSIAINLTDIEYFRHTASRSTFALIKMLGFGNDLTAQLPSYLVDYWYILVFAIALQWLAIWLYKRTNRIPDDSREAGWIKQSVLFLIAGGLLVLTGRGGTGYRPAGPVNAAKYTIEQNVQLVLNSTFTIIKSWGGFTLEEKTWFSEKELAELYTTRRHYTDPPKLDRPNIVLLIMESFSVEYVGSINGTGKTYTPFLDSLIGQSLVFTNCYANGKKSMDAVPALISSVPKLMEPEYLASGYAANRIEGLPRILKKLGYESAFFHGATNGSMNFDVFANLTGFEKYFGRTEYNNDDHFDGTWGIYDDEFFRWSVDEISGLKPPFFASIFSLSSHPPFAIPEKYAQRFSGGPTEMHDAIEYADFALGKFFESASKTKWYDNTLFIVVADHTPATYDAEYYREIGNMHIPLVFFHPSSVDSLFKGRSDKVVSQTDVMPGILHLLGYQEPFMAFGKSMFDSLDGYSASQIGNAYLYFSTVDSLHYLTLFENEKTTGIFGLTDKFQEKNLLGEKQLMILETRLKAMIQTYNHALIHNEMTID